MSNLQIATLPRESATFAPIRTRRTFEEICENIRDRLAAGTLRPGDKLPPERVFALQLGVGRNALREALRSLEIAGIVHLQKGAKGGATIREGDSGRMKQVVQDMYSLGTITLESLTETRLHIQDLVVRLACERADAADFLALDAIVDRTEAFTRTGQFLERIECSREFFHLLAASTRNPTLAMVVASITEVLMNFVYARVAAGSKPQPRLVAKRRAFMDALRNRDADLAIDLMRSHLESVHRMLEEGPMNSAATPAYRATTHRSAREGASVTRMAITTKKPPRLDGDKRRR